MSKRAFEDLKIDDCFQEFDTFDCLPDRAKTMFFSAMQYIAIHYNTHLPHFVTTWCDDYKSCKSPIEKILFLAFRILEIVRINELSDKSVAISIEPQQLVDTGKKKYYVDLYFEIDSWTENVGVAVECDGYEFYQKSKKQVEYDNEREYEIKKCGFDILRFSGSKIYNDPFKCANDIFDYLLLKEKK